MRKSGSRVQRRRCHPLPSSLPNGASAQPFPMDAKRCKLALRLRSASVTYYGAGDELSAREVLDCSVGPCMSRLNGAILAPLVQFSAKLPGSAAETGSRPRRQREGAARPSESAPRSAASDVPRSRSETRIRVADAVVLFAPATDRPIAPVPRRKRLPCLPLGAYRVAANAGLGGHTVALGRAPGCELRERCAAVRAPPPGLINDAHPPPSPPAVATVITRAQANKRCACCAQRGRTLWSLRRRMCAEGGG